MKRLTHLKNFTQNQHSDDIKKEEEDGIPRVYSEPYFYGRITRQEAEDILTVNGKEDGLYLLRESFTPMNNFSISIVFKGNITHYSIERKADGQFAIGEGIAFNDPVSLIEYYRSHSSGLITVPKIPCLKSHNQEAIAYRGLSYKDLHTYMRSAAVKMNAKLPRALGQMREYLMIQVLRTMHEKMPWYHGKIARKEGIRRLQESGHVDGKFLIRLREGNQNFVLSMSCDGQLRHYIILVNEEETYCIENGQRFKTLIMLVDHYHNLRDGLPCKLSVPCAPPGIKQQTLENYFRLHRILTQKSDSPVVTPKCPQHTPQNKCTPKPPLIPLPLTPTTPKSVPPCLLKPNSITECAQPPKFIWKKQASVDNLFAGSTTVNGSCMSSEDAERLESLYIEIREDVLSTNLHPDQITLEGKLGSGQFGEVRKGTCWLRHKHVPVAVKTLKSNSSAGEREINREANLMKKLDHHHIVRLIGFCTGETLMLVMELAALGPLKKYLEQHPEMKVWHQVELILQICDAMVYLASMDVVHRDLATRNVLLVTEHFAKICDFGMSRMLDSDSNYYLAHGPGKWPLMWYAPECLYYHKFDSKSDVWSFGVTMWEIMSFGTRPYDKRKPQEIMRFLEAGKRLPRPNNCDLRLYNLMLFCWEFNKDERPHLKDLRPTLDVLYKEFEKAKI